MYTLEKEEFNYFDIKDIDVFVTCWSKYANTPPNELGTNRKIDYFSELNIGGELSASNVRKLLRWKDPKYLTHTIKSGANQDQPNPRVEKVLNHIDDLNRFRNSVISPDSFKEITQQIFPSGIIWQVFLFHICKPSQFPIVDQHVFRVYEYHTNDVQGDSWDKYQKYVVYFNELSREFGAEDDIHKLKSIDSALMSYGQFLKKYDKN